MAETTNPLPALSTEEYEGLKASIARDGFLYPVIKSAGPAMFGEIVDGFNRERIGKELGIEPPRQSRRYESEAEFRIAQIDANMARRHLTTTQKIVLAMAREPWEKKLAEIRRARGLEKSPQKESKTEGETPIRRATAEAAGAVGLKRDTYEHGKLVLLKGPEEIKAQLLAGAITVDRAYRETRRHLGMDATSVLTKSATRRFGALPREKFGAIVMTPPWRSQAKKFEPGRLIPAELAALDLQLCARQHALLAVACPGRWLRETLELVAGPWRGTILTTVVRLRSSAKDASPLAQRAEFVVLATFGRPELPVTSRDNVIETDAQLLSLLDALVPDQPGIVLFGETARNGWASWNPSVK